MGVHLRGWNIKCSLCVDRRIGIEPGLHLHIADYAYDPRGCLARAEQAANGTRLMQDLPREALVHNCDRLADCCIAVIECASIAQSHAECIEVARRNVDRRRHELLTGL